jgi:hypothetical protein
LQQRTVEQPMTHSDRFAWKGNLMSLHRGNVFFAACVFGLTALPSATCWGQGLGGFIQHGAGVVGGAVQHAGGVASGAVHHAGGVASGAVHHAGGVASSATHHAGGVASSATHHAGGVASSATHHAGGVASSATHHVGGVASGATHHAGGVASGMTHHVEAMANAKANKIIGPNERTTFRETYQGAGAGAASGAAGAGAFAGLTVGPEAILPAAALGAASGAVGGAFTGFGQGVFDTNKGYFEARDPGKHLPQWAKPNTDIRVGYQGAGKAYLGALVGDYTIDASGHAGDPLLTLGALGSSSVLGGGGAVGGYEWNHVAYTNKRYGSPTPAPNSSNSNRETTLTNSAAALHRAGHSDPRRPLVLTRPSGNGMPNR